MPKINASQKFIDWYVIPLHYLQELPDGNGGFIALSISCSLYERYAKARLKRDHRKADTPGLHTQLMEDFAVDIATASAFWRIIRDGLVHQAMPLKKEHGNSVYSWAFHHSYLKAMQLGEYKGKPILKVNPWIFMEKVLDIWSANLELLEDSESFPWARIQDVPT